MNPSDYQVRRATLDDLPQLNALWKSMGFVTDELGRRITEFQIAQDKAGVLVGALGLQIAERQGLVHSEAFTDFALADRLRPRLWERIQAVAHNHGLLRLWTAEKAPFWTHCGLSSADSEVLQRLPAIWRGRSQQWLTLKLREDLEILTSIDHEFAQFMQSEKLRTQRALQQGRVLKVIATLVALTVFALVIGAIFYLIRMNPQLLRH